jgi:hypothetical protein
MNDWMFYIFGLIFLFILWFYAGGPNNPFSFSGPYITPITDVDSTQVGYDDPGASFFSKPSSANQPLPDPARSPYAGTVEFVGSDPEDGDAGSEYMMIRSNTNDDVTITGWQLVSARTGEQYVIPEGSRRNHDGDIRISDGETAVIITSTSGRSDLKGYFPDSWYAYLGERSDIWDDHNDTITLLDANGKVVDQYKY